VDEQLGFYPHYRRDTRLREALQILKNIPRFKAADL